MSASVSYLRKSPTISIDDDCENRWLRGLKNKQLLRLWRTLGTGLPSENGTQAIVAEMRARGIMVKYLNQSR